MLDSDYTDVNHDLVKLIRHVSKVIKSLRESPHRAGQVADQLDGFLKSDGYKSILALADAKEAISAYEIPDVVDSGFNSVNTSIDDADKLLANCRDGSLFHIFANDGRFDEDFHDKFSSLDYDYDHLVVIRQDEEDTMLVRISPSSDGFELSVCSSFDDLFTVGNRSGIGTKKSLPEAIAAARGLTFETKEEPSI